MTNKPLTVDTVSIQTASVSIRALMVNNKQMTLSVFRQLPLRDVFQWESQTLQGELWGTVNYHFEPLYRDGRLCSHPMATEHLHVVWQRDGQLYRCNVQDCGLSRRDTMINGHALDVQYKESDWEMFKPLMALPQLFVAV